MNRIMSFAIGVLLLTLTFFMASATRHGYSGHIVWPIFGVMGFFFLRGAFFKEEKNVKSTDVPTKN